MLQFYHLLDYQRLTNTQPHRLQPPCKIFISPFDPIGIELVRRLGLHKPLNFEIVALPLSINVRENFTHLNAVQEICAQFQSDTQDISNPID